MLPLEICLMLFHKKEYRKPYLKYIISTVKVKYRDIVFISQKLLYQKRITNPESNSYYYKLFNFLLHKKVLEKGLIPFSSFLF
uniref:Uncharacterized protein n=1 Tax=Myoviridae sp. ctIty1 TaxID=2827673 RepID=A0A8S5TG70_9CAUD|nr:MAG TPA: hypothetical protein [Myoviridae sp. ctIty1]